MLRRLIVSVAAVLSVGLFASRSAQAVLHAGDVAPDFHKTDLNGNAQTLYQYAGKVVVLFLLGNT
jgi:uncharacterized Rossmann fold enzyme